MGEYAALHLYIDYDNNATFDKTREDVSGYVIDFDIQRAMTDVLDAGVLQFSLYNCDNRFTPLPAYKPYIAPMYGLRWYRYNLQVGRRVKLTATLADEPLWEEIDSADWDRYYSEFDTPEIDLFTGFISNITPEIDAAEPTKKTVVEAYDLLRLMAVRKFISGALTDKRTDEIIGLVLDSLGASSSGYFTVGAGRLGTDTYLAGAGASFRAIDQGVVTVPYAIFDSTCLDALSQLVQAEYGACYVRKDGWQAFESRHHQLLDRESCFTFTDSHISELIVEYDEENLANHVEVTCHPRVVGTAGTVCYTGVGFGAGGRKIERGGTAEYKVSWTDPGSGRPCEVMDIIQPAASTDYIASGNSDGTGGDKTGNLTVTWSADENERYTWSAVNNATSTVYLTKLQVRATPLVQLDDVTATAEDDESISKYLQRERDIDISLFSDHAAAQDRADWVLYNYKDPKPFIKGMRIEGHNQENTEQILFRELGDRITLDSDMYNIDGDYVITGITHEAIDAQIDCLRAEYELVLLPTLNYWILGTDLLDFDTRLAY
jgi:hypothetical protein